MDATQIDLSIYILVLIIGNVTLIDINSMKTEGFDTS